MATSQLRHERLSRTKALAVFSSDALSSTAYATEEILLVLVLAGSGATYLVWPIALGIAALLATVAFSYYQTIHAYPSGGGAYIVAHDNLGQLPGLTAAAALLTDYVLTVAVSISAGTSALTSAFPELYPHQVSIALSFILIITLLNLRGTRESGTVFSIPTYFFVGMTMLLLALGLGRWVGAGMPSAQPPRTAFPMLQPLSLFLILRAFSSGCAALTGVEAISNGIPAFKPPESENAGKTLITMAALLITMFLGLTFLSYQYGIVPDEHTHETILSQLARTIFGGRSVPYYLFQAATMLILTLAANTAFADFPRLSSILARDRYMPHQFAQLGDRLVFSNGILALALASGLLVVVFHGQTTRLIPLYAIGVFLSFTLSQTGMVVRWWRQRGPYWPIKALINGVGALVTTVVFILFVTTKFMYGAWITLLWIPILIRFFLAVHHHYQDTAAQLSLETFANPPPIRRHRVIIPISGVHRPVISALIYAKAISDDVTAVYVEIDPEETPKIQKKWERWGEGIPLVTLPSPYRSVIGPLIEYVDKIEKEEPFPQAITIVLPQFVPAKRWQLFLHNQTAFFIHLAFLFRHRVMVTHVPFHLQNLPAQGIVKRTRKSPLKTVKTCLIRGELSNQGDFGAGSTPTPKG